MGRTACTEPQCLYKGDLYLYFLPYPFETNYYFLNTKIVLNYMKIQFVPRGKHIAPGL